MKRVVSTVMVALIILTALSAEEGRKYRVSLIPIKSSEGVSESELAGFSTILESSLIATDAFLVIAEQEREAILEEQRFSLSGCSDQSCAIEIGRLLSADYMLLGSVNQSGSRYIVSINLISVETGQVERNSLSTLYSLSSVEEIRKQTRQMAFELAGLETERYTGRQIEEYTGSVTIDVDTPGATLVFNLGETYTDFPVIIEDYPVGEYPVRVTAPGYQPSISSVAIEKGKSTKVSIELEATSAGVLVPEAGKGFLTVLTSPPGMDVLIDYQMIEEKTPLVNYELEEGEHILNIGDYTTYYFKAEENLNVYIEEGKTEELSLELPRNTGSLFIASNVPDAEVFINGTGYGFLKNGNLMLSGVECGEVEVSLVHEKYDTASVVTSVRPNFNNRIELDLAPLPVALAIDSNPQGAEVMFDGERIGKTPQLIDDVPQGTYSLSFSFNGYTTPEQDIAVSGTEDKTIIQDLTNTLTIRIPDANERGALVYLDGLEEPVGIIEEEQFSLPYLSVGEHTIRVSRKGYADSVHEMIIPAKGTRPVEDLVIDLVLDAVPYTVSSEPGGAGIAVDGEATGLVTPATVRLSEGEHEITLSKMGYLQMKESLSVDSARGGMIQVSLLEGTDVAVLIDHYENLLSAYSLDADNETLTRGIETIDGYLEELSSYDADVSSVLEYLVRKKIDLRTKAIHNRIAPISGAEDGGSGIPAGTNPLSVYGSASEDLEEMLQSLDTYGFDTADLKKDLGSLRDEYRERYETLDASIKTLNTDITGYKGRLDALEGKKRTLTTLSVITGILTGTMVGGTGYCTYGALSNYSDYRGTTYSDLATDYRTAVNDYTLAGGIGLGLSVVTGIVEGLLLHARKKVVEQMDTVQSRLTKSIAELARIGMASSFGEQEAGDE